MRRYLAPEVEREEGYGLSADVWSWAAMAYELYHIVATGDDFYEGFNLFTGIETLREPLLRTPLELPARPSACEDAAAWALLVQCLGAAPADRPRFAEIAISLRGLVGADKTSSWLASG